MKVKVFCFPISQCGMYRQRDENALPTDVEQAINGFCETVDVLSINCTQVTVRRHNNGGFDQVELWYNICYQDKAAHSSAAEAVQ